MTVDYRILTEFHLQRRKWCQNPSRVRRGKWQSLYTNQTFTVSSGVCEGFRGPKRNQNRSDTARNVRSFVFAENLHSSIGAEQLIVGIRSIPKLNSGCFLTQPQETSGFWLKFVSKWVCKRLGWPSPWFRGVVAGHGRYSPHHAIRKGYSWSLVVWMEMRQKHSHYCQTSEY